MKVECRKYGYNETLHTANLRRIRDTLHLGRGWTMPSQQPSCATFLDLCNASAVCFLRCRNRVLKCYFHHHQALKLLEGGVNCNTVTGRRLCTCQRMSNKRDFRFSQRYCWRFKCSGMWHLVTGWVQSGHKSPCLRLCVLHVMTRTAVSEDHMIRPYFFDTSVNHSAYLNTPQTWFFPQLSELSCYPATDGAPAHCDLPVRKHLANWADMGRTWCGLLQVQTLTTRDNSLWTPWKRNFFQRRLPTVADIKTATRECSKYSQLST